MLIDFEKAFDTVKWKFIKQTLTLFNFGSTFKSWVDVLYKNAQAAVMNNGHLTALYPLERGVRQCCPLSAYLFILCVELLAIKIRSSENIKGIQISNHEIKISQLADDTSLLSETQTLLGTFLIY